jgi:hypothetical protein
MADTIATSTLTPRANKEGTRVAVRQFKITDIPDAMRKMNWPVAAALMDHWFDGKPWDTEDGGMPKLAKDRKQPVPPQYIDNSIVKMQWLLQFPQAKEMFKQLEGGWNNPDAQNLMRDRFDSHFGDIKEGVREVGFGADTQQADKFKYFNSRTYNFDLVGGGIDELRGALGDFTMKVIAEGSLRISEFEYVFCPVRLGFYIDDTYDFIDGAITPSQPLGFWNFNGLAMSVTEALATNLSIDSQSLLLAGQSMVKSQSDLDQKFKDIATDRYFLVRNKDFQTYRKKFGRGGDFKIYSDIFYQPAPKAPIVLGRKYAS